MKIQFTPEDDERLSHNTRTSVGTRIQSDEGGYADNIKVITGTLEMDY